MPPNKPRLRSSLEKTKSRLQADVDELSNAAEKAVANVSLLERNLKAFAS